MRTCYDGIHIRNQALLCFSTYQAATARRSAALRPRLPGRVPGVPYRHVSSAFYQASCSIHNVWLKRNSRKRVARSQPGEHSEASINPADNTENKAAVSITPLPAQHESPQSSSANDEQPPGPWQKLAALLGALSITFLSLISTIKNFPAWVHSQHLKRLREQSDEDPKNADKQAALLAELNKAKSWHEVLTRVESRKYGSNAAVVVEYLRALVGSGRMSEYAAGSAPGSLDDHKSLSQLLKDLQAQVAEEQPDDVPGASIRRPLHISLHADQLPSMQKSRSPLQVLWTMLTMAMFAVGLSFAWLVGSQAIRRVQAPSGASVAAASASIAGAPAVDPKEYKREELPEKSVKTFKDVKGCDEAKEELKEVVEFLKNPAKFTRLGAKLPKGLLLTGPPGTGKTLLARAVAGEAGVPFFYRAGSEFEELYVGVGSRRMRALFQAAKKRAPCIVFIDEIDAIGGNRKHWENHTRKTLNQLLTEMDGFESNEGVIVIAATNLPETLDPALKRPGRFDRQVAVPLPDIKGRQDLLEYYLHDKPVAADVDQDLLARQTQGFSGADLANLVNEAALLAAKENMDSITPHMLDYAFDKIHMGVERKSVKRTAEGRRRTAYHESGHAIVALNVPGASPIHKATIMPRGHALGMVTQVGRDDEFSINRQQMLARILVCMGGQAAEEIIFGSEQVTSGATDDLRQATEMARHMVTQCGLNEAIGPIFVADEKYLSEEMKRKIDHEVHKMLVEARTTAMALLTDKLQELHALAEALMQHETLTSAQIQQVLNGDFQQPPPACKGEDNLGQGELESAMGGTLAQQIATGDASVD